MERPLHIVSHTDLDGVTAAAVAWHARKESGEPLKISLVGYGEVDDLINESIEIKQNFIILDLICQKNTTIDLIDKNLDTVEEPVFFDHHKTNLEVYGNRKWAHIDISKCAARVYYDWLLERGNKGIEILGPMVDVANDRDLWLGEIEESRLWQALLTLCGPWSLFSRMVTNPSSVLSRVEEEMARKFVERQEIRFEKAREKVQRNQDALSWVGPDVLEFGDVSDFCGLLLDRVENPPRVVAVGNRKMNGDWAVSLRSRDSLSSRVVGLLKDGKKIRGGGHGDAAAVYFPAAYKESQVREALLAAIRTTEEQDRPVGLSLGDLFREKLGRV